MIFLMALLVALVRPALGQTTIASDAWISGRMAVGASSATARLEVQESSTALAAFQVSGAGETPFLVVNSTGSVGAGVSPLTGSISTAARTREPWASCCGTETRCPIPAATKWPSATTAP